MSWLTRVLSIQLWPRPKKLPLLNAAETLRVREVMAALTRTAWVPVTKKANGDLLASRFGGLPALPSGTEHPRCKACHADMPLFVQLNIDLLPTDARSQFPDALHGKLLQFFYCTAEGCNNNDFSGFAGNMLARFLSLEGTTFILGDTKQVVPPKTIESWRTVKEIPYANEAFLHNDNEEDQQLVEDYEHYCNQLQKPLLYSGEKLFGWPDWVQDVIYPHCSVCSKPMQYLFQIGSEDNIDFMFGDSGVGHIYVCSNHPDKPAFYWSCC